MSDENQQSDLKTEIEALKSVADALDGLNPDTAKRILSWALLAFVEDDSHSVKDHRPNPWLSSRAYL